MDNVINISTLANLPSTSCLVKRRKKVQAALSVDTVALISAGHPAPRNFPANHYMGFRAASHFLYLVGQQLPYAILCLTRTNSRLFLPAPTRSGALWHGEEKSFELLSKEIGCEVKPLSDLTRALSSYQPQHILRPICYQESVRQELIKLSGRDEEAEWDKELNLALVQARLVHDEEAIQQLRYASQLTTLAHLAGIKATKEATWAHQVRAAMEFPLNAYGATVAYAPIVTPHGEVLHNHSYHTPLKSGDLLLADVGAETPQGWAGDVTRTWPVNGNWSPTQKAVYEVVLSALKESCKLAKPGVEYAELHQKAREILTLGLIDLNILKGQLEENLFANSIALFFPHGIGHLLGLDVHDMEDLGDLAGYAQGRMRRDTFGWGYLRLDRPLQAGMAITVEPGFYQVPALLKDPTWAGEKAGQFVNWTVLEQFSDVRGIRIEDDLLITDDGAEILSADIPYESHDIIELWNA